MRDDDLMTSMVCKSCKALVDGATFAEVEEGYCTDCQKSLCDCGYPDGSFACRIRHVQVSTANLKRDREAGPNFGFSEQR